MGNRSPKPEEIETSSGQVLSVRLGSDPGPIPEIMDSTVSPGLVLCFGDSLTRGNCGRHPGSYPYCSRLREIVEEYRTGSPSRVAKFPDAFEFLNRGKDGEQCTRMRPALQQYLAYMAEERSELPGTVVILGGTNDLGYMRSVEDICADLDAMYRICTERSIRVVAIEVPINTFDEKLAGDPYGGKKARINEWIRSKADGVTIWSVEVVNWRRITDEAERSELWGDSLHYSVAGYQRMAGDIFEGALRQILIESSLGSWVDSETGEEGLFGDDVDYEWVKDVSFSRDSMCITFKMDLDFEGFKNVSIVVPESYPRGEYQLFYQDQTRIIRGESVEATLIKVLTRFRSQRDRLLGDEGDEEEGEYPEFPDSPGAELETDDLDLETPVLAVDFDFESTDAADQRARMKALVDEVNSHSVDGKFAKTGASGIDNVRIYLFFRPREAFGLSDLISAAWGIDLEKFIVIQLTFSSYYLQGSVLPEIESFQAHNVSENPLECPTMPEKRRYGLYWTVQNRLLTQFFKRHEIDSDGNVEGKNFLLGALECCIRVIKGSPYYCLVCGDEMRHVGIKPNVCPKPLCIFSHEEYGLGCDLESEIMKNASVVDLLISMMAAAASAPTTRFNPFNPYPFGVEVKYRDELSGEVRTLNFLKDGTADGVRERANHKIQTVCHKIPPLAKMQGWVARGRLKKKLDAIDRRLYALLRWIITSNRTHLHKLSPQHRLSQMNTDHQYILMSGTAEKERKFQELKRRHGSFFAWHGSPLQNWHSILREGLKNMSGTKGQLHGAAYGSGVYFAVDSGTSCSYMRFSGSWANSMFSNSSLGMLALCEIIRQSSYKANPYYVIPNEDHIQTRLFFVYASHASVNVKAASVTLPDIRWWD